MEPLFKEGYKVLINSWAYLFTKPKLGDIVAFQAESQRGNILLKKIEIDLDESNYFVVGFNKSDSLDSRSLGPITRKEIIGKFLFTY